MATSLTSHVIRLPSILLVICLCWGVTLGQNGAVNSTMQTSSNSSMPASSVIEGNQNASVTAQPDDTLGLPGGVPIGAIPSAETPSTQGSTRADSAIVTKVTEPTTTPTTTGQTTPSTTVPTTSQSTSTVMSTPSSTLASTTPTTVTTTVSSTTMESTSTVSPTTTVSSTTQSTTTMSSTTQLTTMSSTTPSTTTMSSTTAMPSTTPLSTVDPTAVAAVKSKGTTSEAPISIRGGTSTAPTVSQPEFRTASMKPMVTDTTAPPPLASSKVPTVVTGLPIGTQKTTAVAVSVDNATVVVARTTGPTIRQTSGPMVTAMGSVPPVIRTTQYPDTGSIRTTMRPDLPAQATTAYRPKSTDASSITTGRMTPPQTPRMTQRQTTPVVLPVRTSEVHTTSMPISTSAYDHSRDQTVSLPRVRVTTAVPVTTTAPHIVKTTKITPKVTTPLPTVPVVQTTAAPEIPKDVTYSIRFEGDCSIIMSDRSVREKFEQNFIEMFSVKLGVPKDNILIRDISCGSVDVMVTLMGIQQSKVEKSLDAAVSQPVPLIVNADGQTYAFNPISYSLGDPSRLPPAREDASATIRSTPPPSGLRSVDMIIIIVVSIVGGLLIVIIIALIIHECRRRSHTKSFDLRGTPRPHIHTEDFTLTKMERGPAEYNDYGLVVNSTSNGHTRTPQVGVATIVETPNHHNGDAMHNGYHKAGNEEYEPEYDAGPDSPSISLMKSMRTPDIEGGIENPSFSSEDILDSGTETDKEMVSSDKGLDSPDHAPLQVYPSAESDSGRQSDSLTEIPYDTPPQHSPRSNLSDNTGSDHTYEPYEAPSTPDIPQSPIHHEVLMPIEEVGYPNEETEASSPPPQSPGSPDVLSHSPEHGSYEMVETRSPGKRESDFFAPAEGATAF